MFFFVMRRSFVEQPLNLRCQHASSRRKAQPRSGPLVRALRAPLECAPDSPLSGARVASATPLRSGPFPPSPPSRGWDSIRQNLLPSPDDQAGESPPPPPTLP